MCNLRKSTAYRILLIFGVISVFTCIVFSWTGTVRADSKTEIQNFAPVFYIPAVAVETGSEKTAITEKLGTVTVNAYCSDGSVKTLPIDWDLTSLDTKKPGVSQIQGHPLILDDLFIDENRFLPTYTTQVSVQNPGQPEIQAYSCMQSSGIFVFPWISGLDTEEITVWLKKSGSSWVNLTEGGYAICMDDGLYLGNTAMKAGNLYELAISGKSFQTRILKFMYNSENILEIREYYSRGILGSFTPDKVIRSVEETDPGMDKRCMAFAVETGQNLEEIQKNLARDILLLGSTAETYEDTAENPAQVLHGVWDISGVNVKKPGVYKITGKFQSPEGYRLEENLKLPEMTAYVTVQDPGRPRIDTYYMPEIHQIVFPMILQGFEAQDLTVWISENKESWQKMTSLQGEIRDDGICLFRNRLKQGNHYQICLSWTEGATDIYAFDFGEDFITNEKWIQRNFSNRDGQEFPDISLETTITPNPVNRNEEDTQAENPQNLADVSNPSGELSTVEHPAASEEMLSSAGSDTQKKQSALGKAQESKAKTTEKVVEIVTDKWTVISGKRLNLILKYIGNDVNFEKDGISLQIPADVAYNWEVEDDQTIQALVQKTSDHVYEVKIYKGDQEITDITNSQVVIPVNEVFPEENPATMKVTDSQGEAMPVSLDESGKLLTIQTDKTGTFYVKSRKNIIKQKPLPAVAMIAATGLTVGIRSKAGKRGDNNKAEK